MSKRESIEFQAILTEKSAVKIDGQQPSGRITLEFDMMQAPAVLKVPMQYMSELFKVTITPL